jgi:hypothetical protein
MVYVYVFVKPIGMDAGDIHYTFKSLAKKTVVEDPTVSANSSDISINKSTKAFPTSTSLGNGVTCVGDICWIVLNDLITETELNQILSTVVKKVST